MAKRNSTRAAKAQSPKPLASEPYPNALWHEAVSVCSFMDVVLKSLDGDEHAEVWHVLNHARGKLQSVVDGIEQVRS